MIRSTRTGQEVEILAVDEGGGEEIIRVRFVLSGNLMTCYRGGLDADGGDEEIDKAIEGLES